VKGRPLLFLATIVVGWAGLRWWWLGTTSTAGRPSVAAVRQPSGVEPPPPILRVATAPSATKPGAMPRSSRWPRSRSASEGRSRIWSGRIESVPALAAASPSGDGDGDGNPASPSPEAAPPPPARMATRIDGAPEPRWTGSIWSIWREGGATLQAPQLGGSQIGARLAYAIDPARHLAVAGRVAAAVWPAQQDAAVALEWSPPGLPVRLVAERRIGVTNSIGGWGIGAVAGVYRRPAPFGTQIDGYAQAGAIARRGGTEGYADGAIRVTHPLRIARAAEARVGWGLWGAAQRGAARFDTGPGVTAALPLAGRKIRVALDWREQLAGNARPSSGPTLSIGTDF
jgi:hypothetical protein